MGVAPCSRQDKGDDRMKTLTVTLLVVATASIALPISSWP
jgi:hypothetical protein